MRSCRGQHRHAAGADRLRLRQPQRHAAGRAQLARVGGDEFVALLGLASTEDAQSVAERLTAAIRRVAVQDPGSTHVGATDRVRDVSARRRDVDELRRVADGRLLVRKRSRPAPAR